MSGPPSSRNGWPVLRPDQLDRTIVPLVGGATWEVRTAWGPPAVILPAFARGFDTQVHALAGKVLDDWSYNRRYVAGTAVWSAHASGTAIDLDALAHPRGRKGTYTAYQLVRLRALLSRFDGGITWGGDWRTPDEMHFEIAWGPYDPRLYQLAQRLRDEEDVMSTLRVIVSAPARDAIWAMETDGHAHHVPNPATLRVAKATDHDEIVLSPAEFDQFTSTGSPS